MPLPLSRLPVYLRITKRVGWLKSLGTIALAFALSAETPSFFFAREHKALAAPLPAGPEKAELGLVYYDADNLSVDQKNGNVVAEGNVLFLVGDIYIAAEKVIYQRAQGLVTAEGNVRVLRSRERLLGSRLVVDQISHEFKMNDVKIFADPAADPGAVNLEVLGVTLAEIAFEASRGEREKELTEELKKLREEYVAQSNLTRVRRAKKGGPEDAEVAKVVRKYSLILERLARTRYQPNAVLKALPDDLRQRLERRRDAARKFASSNKAVAQYVAGLQKIPGYIRVEASQLYQNKEGSYEITNALITPCRCDPNERPIWGFSARNATIEPQEYVTLYGTTVDVLNVPVVYSPFLRFPIKTERQTGLLLPSYYASRSGEVFSQPLFITLGPAADSTFVFNEFSNRGRRFDLESRVQLTRDSRIRLYGEFINDNKTAKDWAENKTAIEAKLTELKSQGTPNTETEEAYREKIGVSKTKRWYGQGSWNLPVTAASSLKAEGEFVSDNRYLGDFSKETGSTQNLFAPAVNARRFLSQEAAAEYYGSDFVLSARAQGLHDVFAKASSDTPIRLPRVELYLLPKRFFDLPISFDHKAHWERVHRVGGSSFIDQNQGQAPVITSSGGVETIYIGKNGRRDPTEPFVEGSRTHTETRAELPLPANNYVNAFLSATGGSTQYEFRASAPYLLSKPYQTYAIYRAVAAMPLYGLMTLSEKADTPYASLRQDFTPSVVFTYVPSVQRHPDFPKSYQVFYEEDNITSQQLLEFNLDTALSLSRESFSATPLFLPRIEPGRDTGVADSKIFAAVLAEKRLNLETTPESIFAFSGVSQAPEVFESWATKELSQYESAVLDSDFGKPFVWPAPLTYRRAPSWTINPFTLNLTTSYNFAVVQTAREANARLRPGEPKIKEQPWGPIKAKANWALSPLLPLSGSLVATFDRTLERLSDMGLSLAGSPGYGLDLGFSNSWALEEVVVGGEKTYPRKRSIGTNIGYQPRPWLRADYQRLLTIKDSKRTDGEFEYTALQMISFLNIQDCLDVTLKRFKDYSVRERYATWSIGLNLKFMGQARDVGNIGESFDRNVKSRNEKLEQERQRQ